MMISYPAQTFTEVKILQQTDDLVKNTAKTGLILKAAQDAIKGISTPGETPLKVCFQSMNAHIKAENQLRAAEQKHRLAKGALDPVVKKEQKALELKITESLLPRIVACKKGQGSRMPEHNIELFDEVASRHEVSKHAVDRIFTRAVYEKKPFYTD